MDDQPTPKIEYGVTPTDKMASMSGLDFVRAHFRRPTAGAADHADHRTLRFHRGAGHCRVPQHPRLPALQPDRLGAWRLRRDAAGFGDGACGSHHAARGHRLHHAGIQDLLHQGHDQSIPARSAAKAAPSASAAAPPPPRRASPTPRAGCWRMPPRPAWCSRFPKTPEDHRIPCIGRHDGRRWISAGVM